MLRCSSDLNDFFSGPAYLPWHWMGNLDGWGGPLPDEWIERGRQLQHKFLHRIRALGMVPVLPAFAGFVPAALKKRFPDAAIHDAAGWNHFTPTHYIDPTSPLFAKIGAAFVRRLCAEFTVGIWSRTSQHTQSQLPCLCALTHLTRLCDMQQCPERWFTADLYNELTPPSTDPVYLRDVSTSVYGAIATGAGAGPVTAADSDTAVVWLAQAWMWHSGTKTFRPPWTEEAIRGFLDGPPRGGLVMLDLYAEVSPLWDRTEGFWGHPWIYSTIFNFGGRSGLYGRVPHVGEAVPNAVMSNASTGGSMVGIGAAPEAIETDPIMYDLFFESAWMHAPVKDAKTWVRGWALRRYFTRGALTPSPALDAWEKMVDGPYGVSRPQQGPDGSLIAARPRSNIPRVSCCDHTNLGYNASAVLEAWELLLAASVPSDTVTSSAAALATKATFLHDVADFGVQALSNLALAVHADVTTAITAGNRTALQVAAQHFLQIIDDAELLAATQQDRLLGQWIAAARACAESSPPAGNTTLADLYELNARTLISLWGRPDSHLHEYSYRLWGGMISTFYKPRWAKWFSGVDAALGARTRFNQTRFDLEIEQWEAQWTRAKGVLLPTTPATGVLQRARDVHARHFSDSLAKGRPTPLGVSR